MRNYVLAVIVGLAGLTVGAALAVIDRHITGDLPPLAPPTQPGEASAALPPVVAPDATALPPPPAAAPDNAPAPDTASVPDAASSAANSPAPPSSPAPMSADNSAAPDTASGALPAPDASAGAGSPASSSPASSSPDTAPAGAPPAAAASDSDLPNVDIAKLPVHPVPSGEPTVPTITLEDRNGKTLKEIKPSSSPPPSPQVAAAPTGPQTFVAPKGANARNATAPALAPTSGAFEGSAKAMGGTVLSVAGYSVRLFGVRAPEPRDQCGLGPGDTRSCSDVARDALAQRLQHYPNVSCHVPPGQRSTVAAVCMDNSGTDLGGFLVAEGYALADTGQSFDYAGAEGAAHTFRRGLWKSR